MSERDTSTLDRALDAAAGMKPGTWESVETLATLAIAAKGRPEAAGLLASAERAADGAKAGTWGAVRALAWLAMAQSELA